MSISIVELVLYAVLVAGIGLFLRATLRGGKQLGGLWDRRTQQRRDE
jgi:hypothetical protein